MTLSSGPLMNPFNLGHVLTPGLESFSNKNGFQFISGGVNLESLMVAIFLTHELGKEISSIAEAADL